MLLPLSLLSPRKRPLVNPCGNRLLPATRSGQLRQLPLPQTSWRKQLAKSPVVLTARPLDRKTILQTLVPRLPLRSHCFCRSSLRRRLPSWKTNCGRPGPFRVAGNSSAASSCIPKIRRTTSNPPPKLRRSLTPLLACRAHGVSGLLLACNPTPFGRN